jgi:hypothetical protein
MPRLHSASVAARLAAEELGTSDAVLCREPWESYYILRRGILPCCHGSKAIAPMEDWATAWNAPALQEIRRHLASGRLSPYCLESTGCPIVQRHLQGVQWQIDAVRRRGGWLPDRVPFLRTVNRALRGVPAAAYRGLVRLTLPSSRRVP